MAATVSLRVAAGRVRVHPLTLRRWLLQGRVTGIAKDRNGWWVFESKDIRRIAEWKDSRYVPLLGAKNDEEQ